VIQRPGDRRPVTGRPVHAEHAGLAELRRENGPAAIPAAGIDGDDALHRARLVEQRIRELR